MIDVITGLVVGKMGKYLIEEASMLMGVKDELEELKTELMCIQGYLKDDEAREREDEASKVWRNLVLDIAYDLEDVLDSYNLKTEERSRRRGLRRLTNKIGEMMDAYNIADDIKTLKRRILVVIRIRETWKFNEHRGGGITLIRPAQSIDHEEIVAGLENDAKILLEKLLDDKENKRFMISIFGMGGLGKTAIARKLYNSADVKSRFKYRAWTYVSQEYNTRDMLMRIIRSLGVASAEDLEKIRIFAEEELEVYLHGLLEGKRYLVVVDDIWEADAWESLKRALPFNHEGSRVIITTRIRAVAEGVDERVYAHKLRFLTFEESWQLFEHKAFKNMQQVDEDLQKIGKEMVQRCGGLPLAIVVLAGHLSRKRANEWQGVSESLWRRLQDKSNHVSTVFDLSFKEMRQELKLCFLYLSVFPEDYEIEVEKLIQLLVAEGFIQEDEKMMIEDVARDYIEELIDRSLVEAEKVERGKVISCTIHDLLRDVAIKKSKELNFIDVSQTLRGEQHSSTTCRREVAHLLINGCLCDRRVNKRMRSFLFFGKLKGRSPFENFTLKFKLLRVLNLGGLLFPHSTLPDVIGELLHLRYLGIADSRVNYLPAFISNLRFLQTLDAGGYNTFKRKTDLSMLTSLRHVMGNFAGKLLIGEAVNLQTLRSISSYRWSKLKHELLINLRDLKIDDDFSRVDQRRRVPLSLVSCSKLKNLRVLKVKKVKDFKLSLESEEAVRFQVLVELTLHCDIKKLPKDMDLIFPSLELFKLKGSSLAEDPMPALHKLPRLEDLVLENCDCSRENMRINAKGFGQLRKLE